MSLRKKTVEYAVAAVVLSVGIIAASVALGVSPTVMEGPSALSSETSAASTASQQAALSVSLPIRLTDPPQVPRGTTSLNLTFNSLDLLVGEPSGAQGELSTTTVTVSPPGGSATLQLLRLQNVSQTIATANLPNGSVLYTVTLAVSSVSIVVNGTSSPVSLASGDSNFTVTISQPRASLSGDFALLQLNPVVVTTPMGFQLIPSSVGVMCRGASLTERVGDQFGIPSQIDDQLRQAHGNVTAALTALSVAGNVTTMTVLINNTGALPIQISAVGVGGNFTVVGTICQGSGLGGRSSSEGSGTTFACGIFSHLDQTIFVPVASTLAPAGSSGSACATGKLSLMWFMSSPERGLTVAAGECVELTFSGEIGFGFGQLRYDLVPSTLPGQTYTVYTIASFGAQVEVSCALPLGTAACTPVRQGSGSGGYNGGH